LSLKSYLKTRPALLRPALWLHRMFAPILGHPVGALYHFPRFIGDWRRYRRAGGRARVRDWFPCLFDRTETTAFDPQYFYQAAWAARLIREAAPAHHVDVGSELKFVGMLSAIAPVTFIDIRPAAIALPDLECRAGSLLALPFADSSVHSLSCLHVLEHVGLGRYGDPIDPAGWRKGLVELQRVLAPGGKLYLSTPIGRPRVQYNSQRVFRVQEIVTGLPLVQLQDLAWVDGFGRFHEHIHPEDPRPERQEGLDFSLGMFRFRKADAA
jgi:SAM-dependent methyltransferase